MLGQLVGLVRTTRRQPHANGDVFPHRVSRVGVRRPSLRRLTRRRTRHRRLRAFGGFLSFAGTHGFSSYRTNEKGHHPVWMMALDLQKFCSVQRSIIRSWPSAQ
jgi:hypothetical protein